jgi:hypothetical protein
VLPELSVAAAAGLLICASADTQARFGAPWSDTLLWIGLLTIFVPIAVRLAMPMVARRERIGGVVLLVIVVYLVKVVQSPVAFVFGDEFAHLRTAADILATGRLFVDNPLSLVSPHYPGLELATTALANEADLSIYAAGVILLGGARLVLALALFLLVEELSGSARVAALACLIYAGNSNFIFWTAQFSYESLSLPLAILILYLAVSRARSLSHRRSFDVAILVAGFALVITHHLTTYALLALFAIWALVAFIARRRGRRFTMPPIGASIAIGVWAMVWLFVVAPRTFRYLLPVVAEVVDDLQRFLFSSRTIKTFFRGDPALVPPPWERVVAFGAVASIAAVLLLSLVWVVRRGPRWRRYRENSVAQALAVAAALFFPIQSLRVIQGGTEVANRSGEFLFLPIGFVCALAIHHVWLGRRTAPIRLAGFAAFATLIFMGGVIIGFPHWARLPGAYIVSGDARAIQPESLSASAWLRSTFGTGNGVLADQTNGLLMGSYGGQAIVHGLSYVYFKPEIGREELDALTKGGVRFIVVDRRVTTMLPVTGHYYESGEPDAGQHAEPIDPAQLEHFDRSGALTRVFDSGDIAIFRLEPGVAQP